MYRFIHISDLHLAPVPPVSWRQLFNKRLIGWLNWQFNRKAAMESGALAAVLRHIAGQEHRHLAISGDIVNLALPEEFRNARAKLASLGQAADISLVFGNHDAYVPGAFAKSCAAFAPWIAGDKPAEQGRSAAARSGKAPAPSANSAAEHLPRASAFPYLRIRGAAAFIGVSSAVATPPFMANGYFGARQAAALASLLQKTAEKGLFRVVIIHHPPLYHAAPRRKALWGIKRFQQAIAAQGAELVLHGHTHLPSLSYIQGAGAERRVPVVGAASASQEFGGHKPPAGYNLFSIEKNSEGQWRCELQRFGLADAQNTVGLLAKETLLP